MITVARGIFSLGCPTRTKKLKLQLDWCAEACNHEAVNLIITYFLLSEICCANIVLIGETARNVTEQLCACRRSWKVIPNFPVIVTWDVCLSYCGWHFPDDDLCGRHFVVLGDFVTQNWHHVEHLQKVTQLFLSSDHIFSPLLSVLRVCWPLSCSLSWSILGVLQVATTMPASNPSVMASGTVSMINTLARSASTLE